MEYAHTALLAAAEIAAKEQGPGNVLRIVLVVSLVGAVLLAWLLLRGYRSDDSAEGSTDGSDA